MNQLEAAGREQVLGQVCALAEQGKVEEALKVVAASGLSDAALANAAGVCHLRAGRAEKALGIFRGLCVGDGVGVRSDALSLHVANFAAALLLTGNLSGCKHHLHLLGDSHPEARRLRSGLSRWEQSLGRGQRLGLKLGVWEPKGPIDLGFPPGAFR